NTCRTRTGVRDVGKALGLSLDRVDALAKNMEGRELDGYFYADAKRDKHEDPQEDDPRVQGSGFRVQETGNRGQGTGNRGQGTDSEGQSLSPVSYPLSPTQILALRCAEVGIDPTSE